MFALKKLIHVVKLNIINIVGFFVFIFLKIREALFKRRDGIRVLVYHSLAQLEKDKDPMRITVSPELFERQINYLISSGHRVISMDRLLDYISGNAGTDSKEIVLTFDDGFRNNFKQGYNILKSSGLTATFFLACGYINSKDAFPWYGKDQSFGEPLTWEEVSIMANNGMAIGSHTLSHINLGSLVNEEVRLYKEIRDSKEMLEERIKVNVRYFAYPFGCKGSYNSTTERIVRESGYRAAFTNLFGLNRKNDNPFELRRTRIDWNDTLFKFKMKLAGAYDWLDNLKL